MTKQEFIQNATRKIESIGLTVGYNHTDVDGNTYISSLQTVKGCMVQPVAEAQLKADGREWYTCNIRNA